MSVTDSIFKGLVLFMLGALLYIVSSLIAAMSGAFGKPDPFSQVLVAVAVLAMILGPIFYGGVFPFYEWLSKRT